MTTASRQVVLVGLMASGKSTVGRLLADRLGRPFVDNDAVLTARTGHLAREIAVTEGAAALHAQEAEALIDALAQPGPAVVAAAAAAPAEANAAAAMKAHVVVYLRCRPEVLVARLRAEPDDGHRPFVAGDAPRVIGEQFAARDGIYRSLATAVVDANGDDPAAIVETIVSTISPALAPSSRRTRPGS